MPINSVIKLLEGIMKTCYPDESHPVWAFVCRAISKNSEQFKLKFGTDNPEEVIAHLYSKITNAL